MLAKRVVDVVGATIALLVLWPIILLVAILVWLRIERPVLFQQQRPGLNGRLFTILKFRTMTDQRDANGALLPDGERLTKVGRMLRELSMDELPELWNVLRGDMSLVGPRPLLACYLDRYSPEQARRHELRPGLTGLAQVSGRNALQWEQKFELDVWYVDHRNMLLDLRILALTFWRVVKRQGVNAAGEATMSEFLGSLNEKDDLVAASATINADEPIQMAKD